MDGTRTIGIDVGATKVVAGVVAPDGEVVHSYSRRLTPGSHSSGLVGPLVDAVTELRSHDPDLTAVGVGAAGLVHWPSGQIEYAVNHSHRRLRLRDRLAEAVGLPVVVDNDANAAAWGEARTRHGESVLFLAIGTGLGSGFVADGQVMRGPGGRGAELGHVVVDDHGPECACGLRGCLETLASGRALREWGRSQAETGRLALRRDAAVTTRLMIDFALRGEPLVVDRVHRMGHDLGRAIAHVVTSLYPVDRVVVGGGLAALGDLVVQPMRDASNAVLARSKLFDAPRVSLATHGESAILVGAGLLAQSADALDASNGSTSPRESSTPDRPGRPPRRPDRPLPTRPVGPDRETVLTP